MSTFVPVFLRDFWEDRSAIIKTNWSWLVEEGHYDEADSMMEHLDKRIDDKVDSKLGPVMDRLTALEKTSTSSTQPVAPRSQRYLRLPTWKSRDGVLFRRSKHAWFDREVRQENLLPSYDRELDQVWAA